MGTPKQESVILANSHTAVSKNRGDQIQPPMCCNPFSGDPQNFKMISIGLRKLHPYRRNPAHAGLRSWCLIRAVQKNFEGTTQGCRCSLDRHSNVGICGFVSSITVLAEAQGLEFGGGHYSAFSLPNIP